MAGNAARITASLPRSMASLSTNSENRFIADAMLGRLARWLRLLGFDTLYYPDIEDRDLLKIALREDRTILSRDSHFLGRKDLPKFFMVRSDDPRCQITAVLQSLGTSELKPGRCAQCNGTLLPVSDRQEVRDCVPEYVFLRTHDFMRCLSCGKVYWEGTHLIRFRAMIRGAVPEARSS